MVNTLEPSDSNAEAIFGRSNHFISTLKTLVDI